MTAVEDRKNLDKFGLQADASTVESHEANPNAPTGWVPIRDLHARHRHRILDHLLQLDEHDRYLRFGSHIQKNS